MLQLFSQNLHKYARKLNKMVHLLLAFLLFFSHVRHHERAGKQAAGKSSIQTCDDVSAIAFNADWMTLDGCSNGDGWKSVCAATSGTVTRVVASCWKKGRKSACRVMDQCWNKRRLFPLPLKTKARCERVWQAYQSYDRIFIETRRTLWFLGWNRLSAGFRPSAIV